jgi:hypothetical protein
VVCPIAYDDRLLEPKSSKWSMRNVDTSTIPQPASEAAERTMMDQPALDVPHGCG